MVVPKKYSSQQTRVFDQAGEQLCDCRDEATAALIAEALSGLSAYEAEHTPPSANELEKLTKMLEEFNRQYDAEHPDFDPGASPFAKYFKT